VPSANFAPGLLRCAARWGLLTQTGVAIDGSKFKAVNNRDRNFTRAKMERRIAQIEESVARYLQQLDTADRQEPSEALKTKTSRLKEKIAKLKEQMRRLKLLKVEMLATPDQQISLTVRPNLDGTTARKCRQRRGPGGRTNFKALQPGDHWLR
jgi:hypothetical protein